MSLYELKPWFRRKLTHITYKLWSLKVTPNQITIFSFILCVAYGFDMFSHSSLFFFFPLFVLLRMALNAIDGHMANMYNMKTQMGLILNEVTDIASDLVLFIPFMLYIPLGFLLPFLGLVVLAELSGILGIKLTYTRHYHGPLGKSDRALVFSVISWIVFFHGSLPLYDLVFIGLDLLLLLTIYNRLKANHV